MALPELTRCGAPYAGTRATCDQPPKHIKSASDRHKATITSTTIQTGTTFRHTVEQTEHIDWAPNMFEIPSEDDE